MATNEILQFAETDTGTNLLTQAEYLADAQRPIGNQPGVARSKLVNKALRQSSLIAAAVAQFIADNQANNVVDTATPATIADWIEAAVRSIGIPTAVAGGTADAITADFTPNVALTNGITVIVRAGAANATTTPTFAPDGLTAKTIVKGNNLALAAGDIAGAGHWLEMNFDTTLDKWVLQNPATGVIQLATSGQAIFTSSGSWVCPAGVTKVFITAAAGGGSGGQYPSGAGNGGGGGGGAAALSTQVTVVPGTTYTVTVGAGGASVGSSLNGNPGGATSFGALLTLTGGGGGINTGGGGTAGGFGSQDGQGTSGGDSLFGIGGTLTLVGAGYGAGGGGAAGSGLSGAGASGFLLVEW